MDIHQDLKCRKAELHGKLTYLPSTSFLNQLKQHIYSMHNVHCTSYCLGTVPQKQLSIFHLLLCSERSFFDLGLLTINFLYLYIPKKNSCLGLDPKKLHNPLLGLVLWSPSCRMAPICPQVTASLAPAPASIRLNGGRGSTSDPTTPKHEAPPSCR